MMMGLMLVACLASWALVALMLGDAGTVLRTALRGDARQGWMPGVPVSGVPVSGAARRAASSRAFIRA